MKADNLVIQSIDRMDDEDYAEVVWVPNGDSGVDDDVKLVHQVPLSVANQYDLGASYRMMMSRSPAGEADD